MPGALAAIMASQRIASGGAPFSITIGSNTTDTYAGVVNIGIESGAADLNDPNPSMRVNGSSRRGIVRIDFSAARTGVGANAASLSTASLSLYKTSTGATVSQTVYEVLRAVVMSQVTWNSYSTGNAWATAGGQGTGDYTTTPVATRNLDSAAGYQEFSGANLTTAMLAAFNAGGVLVLQLDANPSDFTQTTYVRNGGGDGSTNGQRPFVTLTGTLA